MKFSIIAENIDIYLKGVLVTFELVSLSLLFGLVIAVVLSVALTISEKPVVTLPIRAFVYFFRGTPLLIQMFLIYYGMGQFEAIKETFLWDYFKEAHFALFSLSHSIPERTQQKFSGAPLLIPQRGDRSSQGRWNVASPHVSSNCPAQCFQAGTPGLWQ